MNAYPPREISAFYLVRILALKGLTFFKNKSILFSDLQNTPTGKSGALQSASCVLVHLHFCKQSERTIREKTDHNAYWHVHADVHGSRTGGLIHD